VTCKTDKQWHRSDAAMAAAPVAGVRVRRFSCTSVPGVVAPRGFAVAPSLDGQITP
jgi:hypothetical protein